MKKINMYEHEQPLFEMCKGALEDFQSQDGQVSVETVKCLVSDFSSYMHGYVSPACRREVTKRLRNIFGV